MSRCRRIADVVNERPGISSDTALRFARYFQVNCALADAPRDRSADGIRLKLEKSPTEFSEELGGSVMFLMMPPAPGKSEQQAPGSDATPAPNN